MRIAKGLRTPAWLPREMAIAFALVVVEQVFQAHGFEAEVTSGMEGTHKRGSAHFRGNAFDLRVHQVPHAMREPMRDDIADRLGPQFDVILEQAPPHIHIEWDPKTGPC